MELNNAQVLVLDDDADIRALVRRLLEGAGMRVSDAQDVEEAFRVAMKQAPHVIISDLNMPGQSGFAFIERCRKTEWLREVPILVISANNDSKSVYRAISLGATDYLIKPFHSGGLTQKLRKVLKNKTVGKFSFSELVRPSVRVIASCSVTEASESGFRLEAPIRLGTDALVDVQGRLFEEMGLKGVAIKTASRPPTLRQQGNYLNELHTSQLAPAALTKIRNLLRNWK